MTTTRLQVASDAMISAANPSKNYGGLSRMSVNTTPNIRRGFVYFNQPFPLGVTVLSATLHLYQKGFSGGVGAGTTTITVQRTASRWVESKLTYDNAPATVGGTASATFGLRPDGSEWAFDVQSIMQAVADGGVWYGLRISSSVAATLDFYAREGGDDFAPVLEVEWSDAPGEPVGLSPNGERSVSIARPTLRWDFVDPAGDSTQAAFQVQTNTIWDFVTPAVDTGTVVSSTPEWTLTSDVSNGTYCFWRVRVQDDAGLWSEWSEMASFLRTIKPTVAITAPADSPSNIVYESTPTFSWTVTGSTQKSFQLFLVDPLDTSEVLWTSDKITGTATSMSLPSSQRLLMSPGESYRLVLRVWDTVAREYTPGDAPYVEVFKDFSYGTSGAVAGVTGLTFDTEAESPFATLSWSRSTAPDEFVVIQGGKVVAILDPADVHVTGTKYSYVDRNVPPRVTRLFGVAARAGAATSNPATVTGVVAPLGVWLYELDGDHAINILGDPDPQGMVSAEPSEDTAVHLPVNADNPVLITQSMRGPTGAVAGVIERADLPDWLFLAAKRGVTLGMTRVDLATKVQIFNTVRNHADEFSDFIPVAFEYVEII